MHQYLLDPRTRKAFEWVFYGLYTLALGFTGFILADAGPWMFWETAKRSDPLMLRLVIGAAASILTFGFCLWRRPNKRLWS